MGKEHTKTVRMQTVQAKRKGAKTAEAGPKKKVCQNGPVASLQLIRYDTPSVRYGCLESGKGYFSIPSSSTSKMSAE